MLHDLSITFKDIPRSEAVEAHIREKADKLNQFFHELISCHVVVSVVQKGQQKGEQHNIHITLNVPGKELVATRNADENMYIAIRDAFENLRDQLQSYREQLQGKVKVHPDVLFGEVARIFEHDQFGFIQGTDGNEYYFNSSHVTSVPFDRVKVGQHVNFISFVGDDGLQAHRVNIRKQAE